jgi:uncharacterized protein (DUF1015 family)
MNFEKIALHVPTILLPRDGIDLEKWAVVACDQYTSQPDYWERVRQFTGDSPSTLKLTLPEVYLESPDVADMITSINKEMEACIEQDILIEQPKGFMLVERTIAHGKVRRGLIAALDLENYDYTREATTLIRATEGTIIERLPPRIKVREHAPIELPHIMVLIDDPDRTVIEPQFQKKPVKTYDTDLMMESGHVSGYLVSGEADIRQVAVALERLAAPEAFAARYGVADKPVLLYALGDGNHSFATAKVIWENLKKSAPDRQAIMSHPARYALVELVNIHDEGLEFEPIYRVMFNVNLQDMLARMESFYSAQGSSFAWHEVSERAAMRTKAAELARPGRHMVPFVAGKSLGLLCIDTPVLNLEVATLQAFLDAYMKERPEAKIDYIHGADVVAELGSQPGNIGFALPVLSKFEFFKTVILDGALPRKTFSMGEASEKRFYLECRKITA